MAETAKQTESKQATTPKAEQPTEIQILKARQDHEFAMTKIGQEVKQFEIMQRKAVMYSQSTIIPQVYKGNIGNCVIALEMAQRMGANPMMVMQNLDIIQGKPGFSSKFLIGTINATRRFTPLRYEYRGTEGKPDWACRCYAYDITDTEHKEPLYGDWVSMEMAQKEGWLGKSGSKWQTMPSLMMKYRSAAFWARVYCPEISLGLMTSEELTDTTEVMTQATEQKTGDDRLRRVQEAMFAASQSEVVDTETGEIIPATDNDNKKKTSKK